MPLLGRRNAKPLLQMVKGKRHATQDDHADPLPTPPSTDGKSSSKSIEQDDIFREPDDSSDDEKPRFLLPSTVPTDDAHTTNSARFTMPKQIDSSRDESDKAAHFKTPASLKIKSFEIDSLDASKALDSDEDGMIFENSAERSQKRQKRSGNANIFAVPGSRKVYSAKARESSQRRSKNRTKSSTATPSRTKDNSPAKPEFRKAKGGDMFEFGKDEPLAQFQKPRCAAETDNEGYERPISRSSSRSSLSEPPSEEEIAMVQQGLPEPRDYRPECAICGEPVSVLLKEEFENQYTDGKTMLNYKWQQRFCRWHKEQDAKGIRDERGYPEIDWNRLERRMRRHHRHLKDVMSGSKSSYYRDQLSEKIKGRSKTTMQMLNNDGTKRGALVGYYGPRGERVMTEHIVNHLSDQLGEQSSKDKVVAAAGVSGGVSGFVQAVLVPELAEQLVMEDLKVSSQRAREVIAENAELGELLYPDVDDKVAEAVEL